MKTPDFEISDELVRELGELGCSLDLEWNPPAGPHWVVTERAGVRQFWRGRDVLLVQVREDIHVDWALLQWAGGPGSGPNGPDPTLWYQLAMRGCGPSSSLREPRHTWFGNGDSEMEGYLFYVQPRVMAWAFDCLREWFDFDGDEP